MSQLTALRTNGTTRLTLKAAAVGWRYSLDTCTNLVDWMPLTTLTVGSDSHATFVETNAPYPRKFYRARLMP